jgi:carbohydrate-binding DOMON domain-containing protein
MFRFPPHYAHAISLKILLLLKKKSNLLFIFQKGTATGFWKIPREISGQLMGRVADKIE